MIRRTFLAGSLLVLAASAIVAPAEPQFSPERFKAHVTFLADDLLEGRAAGTRGYDIAARYIASQFALLGVAPGASNGTYFQRVDLFESRAAQPAPRLTLSGPRGTTTLKHGVSAVLFGPLTGQGVSRAKGPIVFVGFGMQDAAMGYDDYRGLDVKGKVALVLFGSPKGIDSEVGAHLQSEAGRVAAAHGAIGVLFVPTRATAAAFPWEKVIEYAAEPTTTWVRKDGTPHDPTRGLKAGAFLAPEAAAALMKGAGHDLESILAEADTPGGRPKGFALNTVAELTIATTTRTFSSPNVIGLVPGADATLKDEYVVLMGHADHIGVKAGGRGDRINNGAVDNAAGIATLLEVARAVTAAPDRPRRSILLVANTAEEKGLLGAAHLAHDPPVPIGRIAAAINLDMPMLLYDFTDVVAFGATHSTLQDVFEKAGTAMGITLSPDPMPEQAIFTRSDHYPMVKAGVPAVMLATGMANGGEAAWGKYLGGHYHQPSDDLALAIDWKAAAKFAEFNYRALREVADAATRPRWYAGDYFGALFAPQAEKAPKPPR